MRQALLSFDEIQSPAQFERHALALFLYQYENNNVYRSYCDLINCSPSEVKNTASIPFLPIQFFKTHTVICGTKKPKDFFASSRTTGQQPSKHYITEINLYVRSFVKGFTSCYGAIENYALLALLPTYIERNDSSLVYMTQHLIDQSKHPDSGFYLDDIDTLHKQLHKLEKVGQPTILLGVSFALLNCIEQLKWNLKNTVVMETGGMKGMRKEWVRDALHQQLQKGFGVANIHAEYGMTELFSQAYSSGKGFFKTPPWMKVIIRSTEDPFELLGNNKTGALNIIDLANVDSCAFIATEDLGKTHQGETFEVLGRFDHAEIRGCNLMTV